MLAPQQVFVVGQLNDASQIQPQVTPLQWQHNLRQKWL